MRRQNVQRSTIMPAWVMADGPANDVALSTRARLARNVAGVPFPTQARDSDLRRVADLVLDALSRSDGLPRRIGKLRVIRPAHLSGFERLALVDARVASREHVDAGSYRPVVLNETGTLSVMVNEEDHLRIQCILPGLQPMTALRTAQELESFVGSKIGYAKTDNYGYLTSSLANIGTGLRLSAMLHLAGLSFLEEAVPALTAATELKVSVRGLFGEGTRAFGDIFQVSNETTIGFSEREITSRIRAVAEHLIARELEARREIASKKKDELSEIVQQARRQVTEARALSGRDAMECLSALRLGAELGLGPSFPTRVFNELLVSMRIGISAAGGPTMESVGSDVKRARLVRERLTKECEAVQLVFPEVEQESLKRRQTI